jgi:hypothetical protein
MTEKFILSVPYKNQDRHFDAELRLFGYTHKIAIVIDGVEILFEPDEERNYRAVVPDGIGREKTPDIELLEAIAKELELAFK